MGRAHDGESQDHPFMAWNENWKLEIVDCGLWIILRLVELSDDLAKSYLSN